MDRVESPHWLTLAEKVGLGILPAAQAGVSFRAGREQGLTEVRDKYRKRKHKLNQKNGGIEGE